MRRSLSLMFVFLLWGCPRPEGTPPSSRRTDGEVAQQDNPRRAPRPVLPAGSTCAGRDDCPSDQICVQSTCVYLATSTAGEVLANAAAAQEQAGDIDGAARTFEEAIERFRSAGVPVPPQVLCNAAATMLRTAGAENREKAARAADDCFRQSLPTDMYRRNALQALGRLRFEGLDLTHYDAPEPPRDDERFFSEQPSEPTADAVEIEIEISDRESPGFTALRDAIRGEAATRAIVDCFTQDWNVRHERNAQASLLLRYETQMRDMGEYDVWLPHVEVQKTTLAEDGFEPCTARALTQALAPGPRSGSSVVSWTEPFEVRIRIP